MSEAKLMVDNAILNMPIGGRLEVELSTREGNSLKTRLYRELMKLRKVNIPLADSLWISINKVGDDQVKVTLGRGSLSSKDSRVKMFDADGNEIKMEDAVYEQKEEYDESRMRELMERDGMDKDTIDKILNKEKV